MLCELHSVYKIMHCIHCVILHRGSQIIIHYTVKGQFFAFNLEKNYTRKKKIYTCTACGACDKYEVCSGPHVDQSKRIFKIKICQGRNSTDWQEWVILQLLWIRNNHLSGPHLKINLNILQRALCLYTIYKYNIISITLELLASQR